MDAAERAFFRDPGASERRLRVEESAEAAAARLHGARPFPLTAAKILSIANAETFDVDAVVAALEADAPLATRVLRIVNSSAFALRTRCVSVRQAVTLLGATGVREAAVAGAVFFLFPDDSGPFWADLHEHATRVGAIARHLAPEWRLPAEAVFMAAFLHDIGRWFMLEQDPSYIEILERRGPEDGVDAERERFGFDHADLAEHVLRAWKIPSPVPEIVGAHHDPASAYASPAIAGAVAVVRLADLLAHAVEVAEQPDFDALARTEPMAYLGAEAASLRDRFFALAALAPSGEAPPSSRRRVALRPPRPKDDAICALCETAFYGASCERCAARLCGEHHPGKYGVCRSCEAEYDVELARRRIPGPRAAISIAAVGATACAAAPLLGGGAYAALAAGSALVCASIVFEWRRWLARRDFLARRRP